MSNVHHCSACGSDAARSLAFARLVAATQLIKIQETEKESDINTP